MAKEKESPNPLAIKLADGSIELARKELGNGFSNVDYTELASLLLSSNAIKEKGGIKIEDAIQKEAQQILYQRLDAAYQSRWKKKAKGIFLFVGGFFAINAACYWLIGGSVGAGLGMILSGILGFLFARYRII